MMDDNNNDMYWYYGVVALRNTPHITPAGNVSCRDPYRRQWFHEIEQKW